MIIYKRHIGNKLLCLCLAFFILGITCFFAFQYNNDNLGYFIAVAIITLSIVVVKNFTVFPGSFVISNYYFFGLIKITWRFNKGDSITISSYGSDFGQNGEIPDYDHNYATPGLGCLYSVFLIFFPFKIIKKNLKIEKIDESNKSLKRVHIFLNKYEFDCLQSFHPRI